MRDLRVGRVGLYISSTFFVLKASLLTLFVLALFAYTDKRNRFQENRTGKTIDIFGFVLIFDLEQLFFCC